MIPVAVLGATGSVGQMFVKLLQHHPWFEIKELIASRHSAGKRYQDTVDFMIEPRIGSLIIKTAFEKIHSPLVFSGLDASVAGEIERGLAEQGKWVVSNCRNWRLHPQVPLVIPEVNPEHLELLKEQSFGSGKIVTNPNCCVVGLAMALKPLETHFGIEKVHVVTLQAISGAGFRKRKDLDIEDNVIPFIAEEEAKIEKELKKILNLTQVSAHCNRVPVTDGHLKCVTVKLKRKGKKEELIAAWDHFSSTPQALRLPSAPEKPIHYLHEEGFPQPKHHRDLEKGMAVSIGRLRDCSLFDYKFTVLSHNTIRGAAGCALLNAELLNRSNVYF